MDVKNRERVHVCTPTTNVYPSRFYFDNNFLQLIVKFRREEFLLIDFQTFEVSLIVK